MTKLPSIPFHVDNPIWKHPPADLHCDLEGIHLWLLDCARQGPDAAAMLDDAERVRASRFLSASKRARFIEAHAQLRRILAAYTAVDPKELVLSHSSEGKPRIAAPEEFSSLHFNLSHSEDLALLAVARLEVGVDIELIRDTVRSCRLARLILGAGESEHLLRLPENEMNLVFHLHWTLREAFCKARGKGILSLLGNAVSLTRTQGPFVGMDAAPPDGTELYARALFPLPGYVGAVAAPGREWDLMCYAAPGGLDRIAMIAPVTSKTLAR